MKSIDTRRLLGLILMGIGLLFEAIYLSGPLNRAARSVSTPQPNYGPLVPTSIGKVPTTTLVAQITITLMRSTAVVTQAIVATRPVTATSTALPQPTFTVTPAPISPAPIVPAFYTLRQRVGVGVPLPDRARPCQHHPDRTGEPRCVVADRQ